MRRVTTVVLAASVGLSLSGSLFAAAPTVSAEDFVQKLDSPWDIDPVQPPLRVMKIAPDCDPHRQPPQWLEVSAGRQSYRLSLEPVRPLLISLAFLAGALLLSVAVGSVFIPPADLWRALISAFGAPAVEGQSQTFNTIVLSLRLPRTLLGGDWADAVAVTFTPTAVFAQTPGPGAGNLIAGRR